MRKHNLIIMMFLSLIALCVASISITFAWYSEGQFNRVDQMDISLSSNVGLKLSVDNKEFKEKLSLSDFTSDEDFLFEPVSSMYSSSWLAEKSDTPQFRLNDIVSPKEGLETKKGFVSSKIYIKPEFNGLLLFDRGSEKDPLCGPNYLYNETKALELSKIKNDSKENIQSELNKITNSLRFSVLINDETTNDYRYFIIDPAKKKDEKVPFFGRLDLDKNGYYDTTNNSTQEIVYGQYENEDKLVYKDAINEDSSLFNENIKPSAFNAKTKKNTKSVDLEASIRNGFSGAYEESLTVDEFADTFEIRVRKNEIKSLTLSIYFEGWDKDNIEETKFAGFYVNFKFKAQVESFSD